MKISISVFLILLTWLTHGYGQKIEDLSTNRQVVRFLKNNINTKYTFKEVFDREKEIDQEDFEDYVKKIDIDNNGYTDLIVDGYTNCIIILNYAKRNFKEVTFESNIKLEFEPELHSIDIIEGQNVLVFKTVVSKFEQEKYADELTFLATSEHDEILWGEDFKYIVDSLIIKHDKILSYNQLSVNKIKVEEISFETSGCFGVCPIFKLKIDSTGIVNYTGIKHTKTIGSKIFKLKKSQHNQLVNLIQYSDLTSLDDSYAVNWTDDQTGKLKIEFEDGSSKEIKDYGLRGTVNLKSIYEELLKIANN